MKLKFICIFLLGAFVCFKSYQRQQDANTTSDSNAFLVEQQTRSVNVTQAATEILPKSSQDILGKQNN